MRILILGHQGMLGHDLMAVFSNDQPMGWDTEQIDITDQDQVVKKIGKLNPEIVINAAAYTDVDQAETNQALALKVNATAVGYLAKFCAGHNIILVHYSTDYVFGHANSQGVQESDQPAPPLNFYGQSKRLGEQKILNLGSKTSGLKYYLIRTAWLFGPKANPHQHHNFVDAILKLAQEKNEIKVVDDQFGSPTYTNDLALATKKLLANKYPSGIYHLTNSGVINWHQFAQEIIKLAKLKTNVISITSQEFPRPAQRPQYSILRNTKFPLLRPWTKALEDYLKN
ncbi:dTDP-4-dehydrorhamnose reductase [Patescibacteria group bacterium]|nr:dTDP-4-dehydrorhamnose reductase [Patescibacteria group bacterium]